MELDITSLISDTITALNGVIKTSEKDFLLLGSRLQAIHGQTGSLTDQTAVSAGVVQGKEGNRLDRLTAASQNGIEGLKAVQETIRKNTTAFPLALAHVDELAASLDETKKTARQINTIALEFTVETARIGATDRNFIVLADEVKGLSQEIFKVSDKIKSETISVKTTIADARSSVGNELERLKQITLKGEASVETAMERIRELTTLSLSALEAAASVSENVNARVTQIIVAMQMQDNISQRISHIIQGLEDIQTLVFSDTPIGTRSYTGEQRKRLAWAIHLLQVSQMKSVITDLKQARQDNLDAFEEIAGQIRELNRMIEETQSKGNSSRIFSDLSSGLEQLSAIRNQGLNILDRFRQIASTTMEAGTRLSKQVSKVQLISEDAHIKSLNAIIAALKLRGNGAVYKVLATELRDRAVRVSQLTEKTEQAIERISMVTRDIKTDTPDMDDPSRENPPDDREGHPLKSLYQAIKQQMDAAVSGGKELTATIRETISGLDAIEALSLSLEGILADLAPMEDQFSLLEEPANELLLNDPYFQERYTMDTERAVHSETLGEEGADPDDYGDNIEFF